VFREFPQTGLSVLRVVSDWTKLYTKPEWRETGLIGTEKELLQEAEVQPEVVEQ
jgi:hypothetical protein